jgi:hypothetical protein
MGPLHYSLAALAVLTLMCENAAAHSVYRRQLKQASVDTLESAPASTLDAAVAPTVCSNKNRTVFEFSTYGGAATFLASLDSATLQKVIGNSGWSRGVLSLAKQLDDDPDFVSCKLLAAKFKWRTAMLYEQKSAPWVWCLELQLQRCHLPSWAGDACAKLALYLLLLLKCIMHIEQLLGEPALVNLIVSTRCPISPAFRALMSSVAACFTRALPCHLQTSAATPPAVQT